jgi:hypothetical protein
LVKESEDFKRELRLASFATLASLVGAFGSVVTSLVTFFFTSEELLYGEWLTKAAVKFIYVPIYSGLSILGIYSAVVAWKGLYGGSSEAPKSRILAHVTASVLAFVLGFATVYFDLSSDKAHFGTDTQLTPMSAVYFSIVTFATVGYGDISPKSDIARFWVSVEILGGLAFTILIFSVVANFIRQPPAAK